MEMKYEEFKRKVERLKFSTISKARKDTGLSYLMGINNSSKIRKGTKINYLTGAMYLAPSWSSGFNVCPKATNGCINGCLNESGRAAMEILSDGENMIQHARIKKTWLFYANRQFFLDWLHKEIEKGRDKARNTSQEYAVRLNGTSDLDIALFKVLDKYKDVSFYDYTKVFKRVEKYLTTENYHLTFSHSENNANEVKKALSLGVNVAMPFMGRILPKTWGKFEVYDADITDVRLEDVQRGAIAGLRVKRIASKAKMKIAVDSGFIVQVTN